MSTTPTLSFKSLEEVQAYAEKEDKVILLHDDYLLDVTSFSSHHPGGAILLRNKHLADIKEEMKFHHPLTLTMATSMAIGSFKKEIQRIVDPDKPLSAQIWRADESTYMKLINSPHWLFVDSPRIFEADWMEYLTHYKWYHVLIVPFMLIAYFFYSVPSWTSFNAFSFLMTAIAGILVFSLIEYCLHRFVFHSEWWLPDFKIVRYMHYFTHGIHHMLPNDPDRLVLPIPIFLVFYTLVIKLCLMKLIIISDPVLYACFWSFVLISYTIYDISHYALHHIDTSLHKGTWFHKIQKFHNRHHFSGEDAGYGVSTPLWDYIFNTKFKSKAQ